MTRTTMTSLCGLLNGNAAGARLRSWQNGDVELDPMRDAINRTHVPTWLYHAKRFLSMT